MPSSDEQYDEPEFDAHLPFLIDVVPKHTGHVALAEVIANHMRDRIVYAEGAFHDWTGRRWRRLPEHVLPRYIQRLDGLDAGGGHARLALTTRDIERVVRLLATRLAEPNFFLGAPTGINALNGFIRARADGSVEVDAHQKAHRQRGVVPATWEAGVRPPDKLWRQLLDGAFGDDDDAEEKEALIEEILGATLSGATDLAEPRLVILFGKAIDTGKSQLLAVLRGLLPAEVVAVVPLHMLDDAAMLAQLAGKLLNASDEFGDDELPRASTLKAVISGEPVVVGTGRSRRPVPLRALHVVSGSILPRCPQGLDPTLARRIVIVEMNKPVGSSRIPNLGKRVVAEEATALLAAAVRGLVRLHARKAFTEPPSAHAAMRRWRGVADGVLAFLTGSGRVELDPKGRMSSSVLHAAYKSWALEAGYRVLPLSSFVSAAVKTGRVEKRNTGQRRLLAGLRLTGHT